MRNGILIVCNNQDVSDFLEWNTLTKDEALNNNKNTCSFTLVNKRLEDNSEVLIYDYVQNIVPITAGQNYMYVNDTYQFEQKYVAGGKMFIDILGIHRKMTILSVDPTSNKIIFTTNFAQNLPVKVYCGLIYFWGTIAPYTETRLNKNSDDTRFEYNLFGFEKLMDKKTVIDGYITQYTREIMWRIVYKFIATDTALDVFTFETALTGTGLCSNTTNYWTEKIAGNYSQKAICTGNGSWSKTISSLDLSLYTDLRFWMKIAAGQGKTISKLTLRIGLNSSNYFEYPISHIWNDREDCWSFESVDINYPTTTVGAPSLSNITRCSFYIESTGTNYIIFDAMFASTGGMTIKSCKRGTQKFDNVRFKGVQPSVVFETLTKSLNEFRYVDYERDLHYYYNDWEALSTFQITPTSKSYSSLQIKVDTSQIINRQLVEGSEAPSQALYTQQYKADWVQTSFALDFKPAGAVTYPDGTWLQGLKVFVNGVEKTVGVDGLVVWSTVNFLYSFEAKVVRNSNFATLANTDTIQFTYYPYKTLSVRYQDLASINFMKALVGGDWIYDGTIIIDKTIESIQIARQRATVEVQTKKDPIVTYEFTTDVSWLQVGQMVYVNDPDKAIDTYFQVQTMSVSSIAGNMFRYKVSLTTKFFGYVEFFQLLLKKANNFQINQNVVVIIPANVDETIGIGEFYNNRSVSDFYRAWMVASKSRDFLSMTWTTSVEWYIGSQSQERLLEWVGTATVNTVSGYNKAKALELVTTALWTAKAKTIHAPIDNNLPIKIGIDVKVLSQSWAGAIGVFCNEYDSNHLLVQAHEVYINMALPDFVNYWIEFTTQNNTAYYMAGVSIEAQTADILLGGVVVQDKTTNTVINPGVAGFSFAS